MFTCAIFSSIFVYIVSSSNRQVYYEDPSKVLPGERSNNSAPENLVPETASSVLPQLSSLATALFSESSVDVLSNVEAPQKLHILGKTMIMTQYSGDDSIARLKIEFTEQDTYGIEQISAASPLVLDIGGNIGFVSILTQLLHPDSQVIVFEPSPLTYFFLRVNLALNNIHLLTSEELQRHPNLPGVYPVFGGVGASKRIEFASMSDSERSKTQSQNGIVNFDQGGDIPVYNLNKFLHDHGLSERIFNIVKLDCECCEYKVVPDSMIWLTDRSKVVSLTGEIHGCGHLDIQSEKRMLEVLQRRGCEFPAANFDENSGRFRETANLNDHCLP